jgi:hypothetical protein
MSTLINENNNDDLADVESDFGSDSQVTSVLPKSKSTPSGDAAVWIAFRDTRNAHARKKIDRLFLDPSRWILRDIDLCTGGNRAGGRCAWLSGFVQH